VAGSVACSPGPRDVAMGNAVALGDAESTGASAGSAAVGAWLISVDAGTWVAGTGAQAADVMIKTRRDETSRIYTLDVLL